MTVTWCTRCVYPSSSAVPLEFDKNGVCSGCRVHDQKKKIDWTKRAQMFKELVEKYRSKGSNYDCIIPVGGGKDSHYQTYYATEILGLKPLLVTYHGNNYLDVGERNLNNMRKRFDADHLVFRPTEKVLIKLNRIGFLKMGDMNWHNHCGIQTYPVQVAVKYNVPLIIWGEHGYTDLGGMFGYNDFNEMTSKYRLEHAMRGFDWSDMVGEEGLTEHDLLWAKYPEDEDLKRVGVRGVYISNYADWDANKQTKVMIEKYGFEIATEPFDRTYRLMSNLDDRYENGAHDYLKYIKFGYGRCSDHVSKDIRGGLMTREEGIELVRKYDHVRPRDIKYWCNYVGMTEEEFDRIADTFRDPRVWSKDKHGNWIKDNIWDQPKKSA